MNDRWQVSVVKVWAGALGSCFWTGRDTQGKLLRFVHAQVRRLPNPGEVWEVFGEQKNHPEFGPQIHVREAMLQQPRGRLIIDFLAHHEAFDGLHIGVTRAAALYAHFGDDLYDVLEDGNEERLTEVEKLPRDSIRPLIDSWQKVSHEANVVRWLSGWNCPLSLARKLIDFYGKQALDKLHQNPYRMLAFTSFKKCDEMASRIGIAADDPRRLTAMVQHALYDHLDHGHTVMSIQTLRHKVTRLLGELGDGLADKAVVAAEAAKVVMVDQEQVSAMGIRLLEMDAMLRVREMLVGAHGHQTELFTKDSAVATAVAEFESEAGYPLNGEQKCAVAMALKERISIICGGAGVGKTTVLKALAKIFVNEVYFMALTGQAARRINHATGRAATTIEYFLRHIAKRISGLSNPLIVVDEASMLDLQLTTRILRACPSTARLLLVGDPAQLPPVNFGLIFHKLAESPKISKTELTIINRQTEESGIPTISRQIRAGEVPSLPEYRGTGTGVSFISAPRSEVIQRLIDVKADLPDAQVLCVKNAGGLGIQDINEVFHRLKSIGRDTEKSIGMSVGEPVIFKKNVAELDVVNGSLGTITGFERDEDGALQVMCSFGDEPKIISDAYLEYLKLAYAITVHSAQGSQFDRVVILVEPSQILDRTLIYTALTRGVHQVVFIGDGNAFEHAIRSEPKAAQREVLFCI